VILEDSVFILIVLAELVYVGGGSTGDDGPPVDLDLHSPNKLVLLCGDVNGRSSGDCI
jgi:hypothetical protein